ncbi:MAG: hypothetical protein L3K18_09535 [Thermoplasmata archaeon]|nr:hypothetical protein [Thermoplasmata archaeon]
MGKLEATRGHVHTRKVPRLQPDTGRMEAIKEPPTEAYRELAKAGLMPVVGPRLETAWCLCSHQKGAHPKDGPCEAKACRKFGGCSGYRWNPRYALEGPTGGFVVGKGRIIETTGEDGKAHLTFDRSVPEAV